MDYIVRHFELCKKFNGVFIFATHYHAFEKKMKSGEYLKDVLDTLVEKAKSTEGVQFCTYRQLWGDQ